MKKAFTLIEMTIVLLIISILMAATMKFGSNRIVDLKAQSIKEQFVGWYNELYSQNMTSSFRDNKKYEQMSIILGNPFYYILDTLPGTTPSLTGLQIKNQRFTAEGNSFDISHLVFAPYHLGCDITDGDTTGDILYFTLLIPENGKQYCFEIPSETCKLIENRCDN